MVSAERLAAIPLFSSLSDSELEELAARFEARAADEGVELCGQGASGYQFFVLCSGSATVTAEGQTLADLGAGDFFGEIAILGGGRRSATVTTTSPTELLVMFGTEFRVLQRTQPGIAARIEDAMRQRLAVGS